MRISGSRRHHRLGLSAVLTQPSARLRHLHNPLLTSDQRLVPLNLPLGPRGARGLGTFQTNKKRRLPQASMRMHKQREMALFALRLVNRRTPPQPVQCTSALTAQPADLAQELDVLPDQVTRSKSWYYISNNNSAKQDTLESRSQDIRRLAFQLTEERVNRSMRQRRTCVWCFRGRRCGLCTVRLKGVGFRVPIAAGE